MILIAALAAAASYVIRLQEIPFGIHSTLIIIVIIILTKVITKIKIPLLLIGLVPAIVFYGALELSLLPWMLKISGLSLNQVLNDTVLRIIFPIPLYVICLIFTYIVRRNRWSILGNFKHSL